MKFKGFDELSKKLGQISKNAEKIDGRNEVSFDELFNESFMLKNTNFNSLKEFLEKSPFKVETNEDLAKIDEKELDIFVNGNTSFNNWKEMKDSASKYWIVKNLGL